MKTIRVVLISLVVWFVSAGWVDANSNGIFSASSSPISNAPAGCHTRAWGVPRSEKALMVSSSISRSGENDQEQDEEMDDLVVKPAFFRLSSQRELDEIQATKPAIARVRHPSNPTTSELELLESSLLPCSRKMNGFL